MNQMFWIGNIAATKTRRDSLPAESAREPNTRRLPPHHTPQLWLQDSCCIIAQRLRSVLTDHLTETQFCGVPGSTIIDAVVTARNTIAYADSRRIPLCMLSFDFKDAFDRIAHNCLFQTLQAHGTGNSFIAGIKRMCEDATSLVEINGHQYGPIPNRFAVRQGYTMSMALCALSLHPFLHLLDQNYQV